jgi:hypothetical protein
MEVAELPASDSSAPESGPSSTACGEQQLTSHAISQELQHLYGLQNQEISSTVSADYYLHDLMILHHL